ncbi:hypothetical protein SYN60AY4M2_05955 [Synechococcus sp. 60AY4M2]|jgi:hypothetical protein|uniref:hypothetical protein n=1 Tax=unclassified Synechococcus TaxID=2626047 RepID=UPI000C5207CD|nr:MULTISPECIES: hypothetical protein [unclassified Synechococcus]PIK94984.1 hypothetical protein SYN60AY4M2_05955 [Synechococcus sp. 60AY4M2]PIL02053.1 hypothetical protein SYN65AY640_10695 [Synechococcus sp. 65AY640]
MLNLFAGLLFALAHLSPSGNVLIEGDVGEWAFADRQVTETATLTVLIRPEASLASWREMLSVMNVQVPKLPRFLANNMRNNLLEYCPQTMWEFHRESEEDVLYEFRSAGCRGQVAGIQEHEIGRITQGPDGPVRIAYAAKPEMTPEMRSRWLNLLGSEVGTARGFPIQNLTGAARKPSSPAPEQPIAHWLQEATEALKRQEDLLAELDRLAQEAQANARAYSQKAPNEAGTRVISLHRGRGDGSPGEATTEFKTTDTLIWAILPVGSLPANAQVEMLWYYEGGEAGSEQLIRKFDFPWDPLADTVRGFLSFSQPYTGRYRVEVHVNGEKIGVGRFTIR